MISTIPFVIGFIIYVLYSIFTFDMYSKKEGRTSPFILILIYIYYSILASYIISFVDSNSSFFEKGIQIVIYIVCGGFFMFSHYIVSIKNIEDDEYKDNFSGDFNRI